MAYIVDNSWESTQNISVIAISMVWDFLAFWPFKLLKEVKKPRIFINFLKSFLKGS